MCFFPVIKNMNLYDVRSLPKDKGGGKRRPCMLHCECMIDWIAFSFKNLSKISWSLVCCQSLQTWILGQIHEKHKLILQVYKCFILHHPPAMSSAMDFLSTPVSPIATILVVILTTLMIRSHARRLGAESKNRYHPVVTDYINTLTNFSRLHDYMTDEFAYKHKT